MILGIIPARLGSTRLVGKPLADIGGKPMIQHTYESAKKSKLLDEVIVAVDDEKLYKTVTDFGGRAIITSTDIKTGSDRIAFVAKSLPQYDIIANIQGDEPFIEGKMIDQAIEPFLFDLSVEVSTLAKRITTLEEYHASSIPKVVLDYNNNALYFSRSPIPYMRDETDLLKALKRIEVLKHIGLYVFKRETLFKFTSLKQTDLELAEKLEQLRMIENGIKIKVVITEYESISVDTQEDLEKARKYYKFNLNQ